MDTKDTGSGMTRHARARGSRNVEIAVPGVHAVHEHASALVCRLAELCIDLRVEGHHLVARGSLRALMVVAAELHARQGDLRAYLKPMRGSAAT